MSNNVEDFAINLNDSKSRETLYVQDKSSSNGSNMTKKKRKILKRLTKTQSLYFMMSLTSLVFLLELIIGNVTHSNSLVADSFHMLSDLVSFLIALIAVKYSTKESTSTNTFGFGRAEVLGSLINAVFLLALCFSIIVEAINRLFEPHPLKHIDLVLTVGFVGLLINIIGMLLFSLLGGHHIHSHGHSHNSHNHSHKEGHNCKNGVINASLHDSNSDMQEISLKESSDTSFKFSKLDLKQTVVSANLNSSEHAHSHLHTHKHQSHDDHGHSHSNMNIRGVFLHVMADAIGSVAVIISALLVKFVPPEEASWKIYIDPLLSMILTLFISLSTIPLLKESILILLQSVPVQIRVDDLKRKISKVKGVFEIHNFYVWSLNSEINIASIHLKLSRDFCNNDTLSLSQVELLIRSVKNILCSNNIHLTTVQIETEKPSRSYGCCLKDTCLKLHGPNIDLSNSDNSNNFISTNTDSQLFLCNENQILEGHSQCL